MIEFLCPNGHRIRCQAEQAGRAAKCPRCGVKFRVPDPAEPQVSEAVGSDSNVLRPEFSDSDASSKKSPSAGGVERKEPQLEFLCPNGHRLFGPMSLQGRPGECPECGSRFRIPTNEDISAGEEAEHETSPAPSEAPKTSDAEKPAVEEPHATPPPITNRAPAEEVAMPTTISGRSESGKAMAALVARLWDMRLKGATLELRLRDGEIILPNQFLKKLSQQSRQGVFSVKELDGSVSLVVVAWDAVARVTLRGIKELPRELAE